MAVVTFAQLGSYGRLGNQMFQHACLVGLASRHGLTVAHPNHQFRLREVFDIPTPLLSELHLTERMLRVEEPKFSYNDSLIPLTPNTNYNLAGYFQTDKYWKHESDTIRKHFIFRDQSIEKTAKQCIASLRKTKPVVAIGVRRTDYLAAAAFHGLSLDYYTNALDHIKKTVGSAIFLVVSDDPAWCKEFFSRYSEYGEFHIVAEHFQHPTPDLVELSVLQNVDHVIAANSSFHWWGAWLNKNQGKMVIIPERWFAECGPRDYQDIACEGWIKCESKPY